MSILSLDNISRSFGELQALEGINLEVAPHELRAVIGPNGAGKTTLFNLVSGAFPPSSGEVIFNGDNINGLSPERRVHAGIVRTFQITEVFLDLPVFENVQVAVETAMGLNRRPFIGGARRRAVRGKVAELIEATQLAGKEDRVVGELAHGDQRVVEVAVALALDPKLLLLDEPTAGMGDTETEHMVRLIRHLHDERGIPMLFIEHDMSLVFDVADRITVLDNGRFLAEGTPKEIAANDDVQAAYLGGSA
ncbi:MAG: ABC transporter ATP-binding protein [Arenicellales bacterium]